MKKVNMLFVIFMLMILQQSIAQQNNSEIPMSFNEAGTAPSPSAMLDIQSSDKGILIPRMKMSDRDAINAPELGLLIFQTDVDPGFYFYSGMAWVPLLEASTAAGINQIAAI